MTGIIGALEIETKKLKELVENKTVRTISGIEYVSGQIKGVDVVVAKCGVGKVFAGVCAQTMILEYHPDCIIGTGVGGSLSDSLSVTDIAIASSLAQHDMDTSAVGDPVGLVSGINIIFFDTDKKITARLEKAVAEVGIRYKIGTISSGDKFICSDGEKQKIVSYYHSIACDMESAAIAHVCYINNVPFGAIRAISDSADGSCTMDYPVFIEHASANSIKIIEKYLTIE